MTHEEWLKEAERLADQHGRFRWETGCAEQVGHTKTAVNLDEKAVAARAALMAHLARAAVPAEPQPVIPPAPPECETEDEKTAYAFGYWQGLHAARAVPAHLVQQPTRELPARVLAMCKARGWSLHWTHRGAYLHLEASELIEALRGKRGDPLGEAADVLLVLMSITESNGLAWDDVLAQCVSTVEKLEAAPRYKGEEFAAAPQAAPAVQPTQEPKQ